MADHFPDVTKKVDCISRETAITHIKENQCKGCSDIGLCGNCAVLIALKLLKNVPAADVRPVVHGEWKNAHPSSPMLDGGGPPYCSVCGKEAPLRSVEVNQWKLERGSLSGPEVVYKTKCFLSNFCPNCGADMRGPNLDTTKGDQL